MKVDDVTPLRKSRYSTKSQTNRYLTTDLSLSAFLQALGHEIIDVRSEGGRGIFVFADTPELRQDILRWGNDEPVRIRVRTFVNGVRDLKGLVGR